MNKNVRAVYLMMMRPNSRVYLVHSLISSYTDWNMLEIVKWCRKNKISAVMKLTG